MRAKLIWMTIENFIGYKLSTQSIVKELFLEYGNKVSDLIIKEHHPIKKASNLLFKKTE